MFKYILLLFASVSHLAFCDHADLDKTKEAAHGRLEAGLEKTALGIVEVAVGVLYAVKGDVAVCTGVTMHGLYNMREGISDFKEAKNLFDSAREIERNLELNEISFGVPDRDY